jgi:DNA-binding transcriptional LysR family regulator
MKTHVSDRNLSLKTTDQQVTISAVRDGIGLGFLSEDDVSGDPDFVEILPSAQDWSVAIWQVTHIDLHRTEKVRQFLKHTRYLESRA